MCGKVSPQVSKSSASGQMRMAWYGEEIRGALIQEQRELSTHSRRSSFSESGPPCLSGASPTMKIFFRSSFSTFCNPVLTQVRRSWTSLGAIVASTGRTESRKWIVRDTFDVRWRSSEVSSSSKWIEVHLITHWHSAKTNIHDRKDHRPPTGISP